jgi:hypothetical protein
LGFNQISQKGCPHFVQIIRLTRENEECGECDQSSAKNRYQ